MVQICHFFFIYIFLLYYMCHVNCGQGKSCVSEVGVALILAPNLYPPLFTFATIGRIPLVVGSCSSWQLSVCSLPVCVTERQNLKSHILYSLFITIAP